jgi:hypothetical protein
MQQDYPASSTEPVCSRPVDAMTTDWKALRAGYEPGDGSMDGAQLVDGEWWHPIFGCDSLQMAVDRARALLTQPVAEGPTDEDLDEFALFWWGSDTDQRTVTDVIECCSMAAYARAVLTKWGANAQ